MNRTTAKAAGLPYYGWFVLAASAVTEMLMAGATAYGAGFFVIPIQKEFGLSRAVASAAIPILFLGAALVSPYAGRILDRYPIRWFTLTGAILFSVTFTIIALTSSLWLMVLALLLPGALGFVMLGSLPTATLASRWFYKRRGLALGIAAIATSGGGFTVAPLLSKAIDEFGWRTALLGEATFFLLIITALALFVLKDNPYKMGLAGHPENAGRLDGALLLNPSATLERDTGKFGRWREILSDRGFWAPSMIIATVAGLCQSVVVAVPPYGHQLGFTTGQSALLISGFSIGAALTKILVGMMADIWNPRILLFLSALLLPVALGILWLLSGYEAVLAACCLSGISLGGGLPTSASLLAARFGAARLGSTMGWTYALLFGTTIGAVLFTGAVFDHTHSYHAAFAILFGYALLVWAAAWLIDRKS